VKSLSPSFTDTSVESRSRRHSVFPVLSQSLLTPCFPPPWPLSKWFLAADPWARAGSPLFPQSPENNPFFSPAILLFLTLVLAETEAPRSSRIGIFPLCSGICSNFSSFIDSSPPANLARESWQGNVFFVFESTGRHPPFPLAPVQCSSVWSVALALRICSFFHIQNRSFLKFPALRTTRLPAPLFFSSKNGIRVFSHGFSVSSPPSPLSSLSPPFLVPVI